MSIQYGPPVIFGVPPKILPIHGLPKKAKVRLRLRNDDFARCFVRVNGTITHHLLLPSKTGKSWHLGAEIRQGQNISSK